MGRDISLWVIVIVWLVFFSLFDECILKAFCGYFRLLRECSMYLNSSLRYCELHILSSFR